MFGALTLEGWRRRRRPRCSSRCSPGREAWFGPIWGPAVYETATSLVFIVAIVVPLMLAVAYLTLWERKLIGWIQIRIGPNRVGPLGLLQPIADGIKLLFKEIILPANANKALFLLAPIADADAGARRLGGDPVRARGGARRHQRRACSTSWR